jgi:hypothetical protein
MTTVARAGVSDGPGGVPDGTGGVAEAPGEAADDASGVAVAAPGESRDELPAVLGSALAGVVAPEGPPALPVPEPAEDGAAAPPQAASTRASAASPAAAPRAACHGGRRRMGGAPALGAGRMESPGIIGGVLRVRPILHRDADRCTGTGPAEDLTRPPAHRIVACTHAS